MLIFRPFMNMFSLHFKKFPSTLIFLFGTILLSTGVLVALQFMTLKTPFLDKSMEWITNVLYYIFLFFFLLYVTFEKNKFTRVEKILFWLSLGLCIFFSETIKILVGEARPVATALTLSKETSFSFPSTHTASMFALLPLLYSKKHSSFFIFFPIALLIAFSRIYVGVHYLHDVIGGIILGIVTGSILLQYKAVFEIPEYWIKLFKHDKEIRRQIAHALFGVILVYLLSIHVISALTLLCLLLFGLCLVLIIKKWGNIPILFPILSFFERDHHITTFPGRGMFYFVLGSFISVLLFPLHIAEAAILILAFGDSITNVAGKYLGKIPLRYNRKKCIEGPLIASIFAACAASIFVPWPQALLATSIAMFVETLPLYFGPYEIDDNFSIPVIASIVLLLTL